MPKSIRQVRDHRPKIRAWTPEEDLKLREAVSQGIRPERASAIIGRPTAGAVNRARRLNLKWRFART